MFGFILAFAAATYAYRHNWAGPPFVGIAAFLYKRLGLTGQQVLFRAELALALPLLFAGAIWVAALAILADVLLWGVQKLITPRGLRSEQFTTIV